MQVHPRNYGAGVLWRAGAIAAAMVAAAPVAAAAPIASAEVSFVGDYSTGDFSQWPRVENRNYNGPGKDVVPSDSARVVEDAARGMAARFEVRPGDPVSRGKERSEVAGGPETGATDGEVMWYQFSTKFDSKFPQNHADLGFGITNQFWAASYAAPPVAWAVNRTNGFWSLVVLKQRRRGVYLDTSYIFDTPLNVGTWHDVTMQLRWSSSDSIGWIKLWLNGQRQKFNNGSYTYRVRTLIPDVQSVRYKEGYYRKQSQETPTGVVYHAGFRCGPGNPPL